MAEIQLNRLWLANHMTLELLPFSIQPFNILEILRQAPVKN